MNVVATRPSSTGLFLGLARAAICALALFTANALALPFPNPDPGNVGDDIDGTGYFSVGSAGSLTFELFDLGDSNAIFGFYDRDTPATLVPIFEAADATGSAAIIDFTAGYVFDVEDNAIQSLFAPVDVLGFYLDFAGFMLYSDPSLNLGGADIMGAFSSISDDYLSLLFFDAPADNPNRSLLSWHVISDLAPVSADVPAPATGALTLLALAMLVHWRRTAKASLR
ncbi:MAG: hypothetical protein KDI09_12860 [Halioglobus sp.]|nr:hypothetical protein [Halioglobus sp.]